MEVKERNKYSQKLKTIIENEMICKAKIKLVNLRYSGDWINCNWMVASVFFYNGNYKYFTKELSISLTVEAKKAFNST